MSPITDSLKVVTLSAGGRPVVAMDLNDGIIFTRVRGSFTYTPAAANVQRSTRARRFGGSRPVGAIHDNASVSWQVWVTGSTPQAAAASAELLFTQIESASIGRFLEWTPANGLPSYPEVAGPGTWSPQWDPLKWSQRQALIVTFTLPVLPLVTWAPCTVGDDFTVDTSTDYTFDAATSADVSVSSGALVPVVGAALATERRARHTARGYSWSDGEVVVQAKVGSPLTAGFKVGVILSATSNGYIEAYVDDNGTNSRLRIDVVIAGVRANRNSVNLGTRLTAGQLFAVSVAVDRGTTPGGLNTYSVKAQYWSDGLFLPANSSAQDLTYSLAEGTTDAGLPPSGQMGWSWVPASAGATIEDFKALPFSRHNPNSPARVWFGNSIPGTAPAKCELVLSSGDTVNRPWAFFGWASYRGVSPSGSSVIPFGWITASTGSDLSNWSSVSTPYGTGVSPNVLRDSAVSGAKTYLASFLVDPSTLAVDDFSNNQIALEVWARLELSTTLSSPTISAKISSPDGSAYGSDRYTEEWGSLGYVPPVPTAAGALRLYRIGVINVPADPTRRRTVKLWLIVSVGPGSTGSLGADFLMVVPARSRALSPTAKADDSTYPDFWVGGGAIYGAVKTVFSDLSAVTALPGQPAFEDHGLGGSLLELPPGQVVTTFAVATRVPNDPTVSASADSLAAGGSIALNVVPRSYLLRSS